MLKPDIIEYYEGLLEMFTTPGWKSFIEDHEEAKDRLEATAVFECPDNTSWQERRGQINKLTHLINYEQLIRMTYDELENEASFEVESVGYDPLH
jgi:hypothetical protein